MTQNEPKKSNRGFASMDPARQREIASKGGHSVPPEKRSFSQNHRLAAEAGRKGGESVPATERSFSQNRELAAEAGRKGGQARGAHAEHHRAVREHEPEIQEDTEFGQEARHRASEHGTGAPHHR